MLKNLYRTLCIATVLFLMLSFTAFASEHTINSCQDTDPGKMCDSLQQIYGNSSIIKYSTTATEACKYSTSVTINGTKTTVWLSAKPSISINTSEDLIIDSESIKWADEELLEYITNYFFVPVTIRGNSPYNEIAIKLGEVLGEDSSIKFCVDQGIESAKVVINEKGDGIDAQKFLDENYYKTRIEIDGKKFDVYLTEKPTNSQLKELNASARMPMLVICIIAVIFSAVVGCVFVQKHRATKYR